jgi:hypothetical protein
LSDVAGVTFPVTVVTAAHAGFVVDGVAVIVGFGAG